MSGLGKSAISAMPIAVFIADFFNAWQIGNQLLPNFQYRHCRLSDLYQKIHRGQDVLDK